MANQKGFSLVELLIVIAIIGVIAAVSVPRFMEYRRTANQTAAVGELRTLGAAEANIRVSGPYLSIADLAAANQIDRSWTSGVEKGSYRFKDVGTFDTETFEFSAEPVSATSGKISYNIIEDLSIRQQNGLTAPSRDSGSVIGNAQIRQ